MAAAQTTDKLSRFALSPMTGKFTPAASLRGSGEFVVKLSADPVALMRSRAPGKQISESERSAIVADLRAQQDALVPAISATGARVTGAFQHALNGIKVRATPEQVAALAKLPGVVAVKRVATYQRDNAESVPFIGAPAAWQGLPGLHGEHIRVAHFDTGIDFTHANFGGPGTVAAYEAAFAANTLPADPSLFGPAAPKVKGGTDLVGDAYFASSPDPARNTPMPDPNPLDCAPSHGGDGHGSHTSGTLAGFGVTSTGATFTGPYDSTTPTQSFNIGPGVAPLADLYEVRVFGCTGDTNVVVDAIDWAVQHDMQVISMSLGAPYGTEDFADAEASENAVESGIVVAVSSGNSGSGPYLTETPGSGDKVLSVAGIDSHVTLPGINVSLSSGSIVAQDSNGVGITDGTALQVVVLPDTAGTGSNGVSLGCNESEYVDSQITGKLVVTVRGTCNRIARAQFGAKHGAAAVALINNAPGYPSFEGPIPSLTSSSPISIPFLGIQGPGATAPDAAALVAAASATLVSPVAITNPTYRQTASFSSAGPRSGDGALKPNVSAPGVSILSTGAGTGSGGVVMSGTSMSAPHVAGSAALAVQAHPDWSADQVGIALVNTSASGQLVGYSPRKNGNGLIQPFAATQTSVIAKAENDAPSLNFGVAEFTADFSATRTLVVQNRGSSSATFSVSIVPASGSPHTATASLSSLTVPAGQKRSLQVHLSVPAATTGDSSAFRQVQGRVVLTPSSGNEGVTLSVPYYLVPRARSLVQAAFMRAGESSANVSLSNRSASIPGTADFYAWGLTGTNSALGQIGLRAVGVQSFDAGAPFGQAMVFAVNTFATWSNAAFDEFDIFIDVDGDGVADYEVFATDFGAVTAGAADGVVGVFVVNLKTGAIGVEPFLADARTDANAILIPVLAGDVGVTTSNPRFAYTVRSLGSDAVGNNASDVISTPAKFNAFNNAISTSAFATLAPGASATVPITINSDEFEVTPALGLMIVSEDNRAKAQKQALLLRAFGD
jgi:subtilisin family serine protease